MAERPKREVIKPLRYLTTSSDEEDDRKKIRIEEDVKDFKCFIENNEPCTTTSGVMHFKEENPEYTNYEYLTEQHEDRDSRTLEDRITAIESELKRIGNMMETILQNQMTILKHLQPQSAVRKPQILPLSTVQEIEDFENIDESTYLSVVQYLQNIGGFNVKEAINFCFKEVVKDEAIASYTWWGRDETQRPLYNKKIMLAIYDAVCLSNQFNKPSRTEFQMHAKEILRTAKERYRSRLRSSRNKNSTTDKDLWNK